MKRKKKLYFHKLSKATQQKILRSHMKVVDFMERYAQPTWCDYQDALCGFLGCWSLLSPKSIFSKKSCINCESCKPTNRK